MLFFADGFRLLKGEYRMNAASPLSQRRKQINILQGKIWNEEKHETSEKC